MQGAISMEKFEARRLPKIGAIRIYLDDMEELYKIASRVGHVRLTVNDEYLMESVAEIEQQFEGRLSSVGILAVDPDRSAVTELYVGKRIVSLSGEDYSDSDKAALYEMWQVLESRKRSFGSAVRKVVTHWRTIPVLIILMVFSIISLNLIVANGDVKNTVTNAEEAMWLVLGMVATFILVRIVFHSSYSLIYADYKRNISGFWMRNRDQILLSVISAVAGGVVGAAVAVFLG